DRPVILFGGLNGGGKTTFLDAIQLCLFGPFAKCSNRNSFSYEEYLKRCINKSASEQEAAIELSLLHRQDGEQNEYILHRSWVSKDGRVKETFQVIKNGKFDQALTENWSSQVEDFIPLNISSLFLFDGEKIEAYANQENSAALINTAIQSLLGLDVVEQLQKDLVIFERRKKVNDAPPEVKQRMEEEEEKLQFLQERLLKTKQDAASLKTHKLEFLKKELSNIEKEFRKKGGNLYQQKEEIERAFKQAKSDFSSVQDELKNIAESALPLMLIPKLLKKTLERAETEERLLVESEVNKALHSRDEALLARLKKDGADKKTISILHEFFKEDTKRRKNCSKQDMILNLPQQARHKLHDFLNGGINSLRRDILALSEKYTVAADTVYKWELEYHSVPTADDVQHLQEKSKKLQKEISENHHKHAALMHECERIASEIEKKKKSLSRISEQQISNDLDVQDTHRMIVHSAKARKTLESFKAEVVKKHIATIERLILESYQQLIRKTSFIKGLKIDPNSFDISLYTNDGNVLSPERLSAGERQLLAIAILWGLAKTSGRPLPTAIDTPLGRLDSAHRENIVKRYFPYASHQVLLFSTDQEIVGGYLDSLKPWIGRSYVLDYTPQTHATQVREGYFQVVGE
ncbi:MAG: DNA sulfur modification protein DndD, partial [Nanoarchaeota archaeon]|nr:DNA sulfur modification protein DndD [Nanoarchaeota archaeon]